MGQPHEPPEPSEHVGSLHGHAAAQAEHLHRPPPVGRDAAPEVGTLADRARHTGHEHPQVRSAFEEAPHRQVVGQRWLTERGFDRSQRGRSARRWQRCRGHDRADELRVTTTVAVELEDDLRTIRQRRLGKDPVPRAVEPVRVGLEAVPQRDARHGEPLPGILEEAGTSSPCSSSRSPANWRPPRRGASLRSRCHRSEVVTERRAPRRHVPTGWRRSARPGRWWSWSETVDDRLGELARLHLGRPVHQAGEVVGDDLVGDRRLEGVHDA